MTEYSAWKNSTVERWTLFNWVLKLYGGKVTHHEDYHFVTFSVPDDDAESCIRELSKRKFEIYR